MPDTILQDRTSARPPPRRPGYFRAPDPGRARPKPARQSGLLLHLTRSTRGSARTNGVVFAARELFRIESLLRTFREHLLAIPPERRRDCDQVTLAMVEMLIAREAMSRPGAGARRL